MPELTQMIETSPTMEVNKSEATAATQIEQEIDQMAENLEKAAGKGEGSKGGHVIGHTKSGKPIYENANHKGHGYFTADEHREASKLHPVVSEERKQHLKYASGKESHPQAEINAINSQVRSERRAKEAANQRHRDSDKHFMSPEDRAKAEQEDQAYGKKVKRDFDHGQKLGPEGYGKYQEQAQNERGVHTPQSGVTAFPGAKGESEAGKLAVETYGGKPDKELRDLGKEKHREKLEEMRAMPKPNLPKSFTVEGIKPMKQVLEVVRKMGKEGLKKAIPHLNDEQKALLREALSKAKAMDFDDKDNEDGEELIELASQKGKAKNKGRHAEEDEKFVKPGAEKIQHQGDSTPEKFEGQVIKAEILEKDWDSMVSHLMSKEGGGHSKESAEKIAGYINNKYVHHFAHKAESQEEKAENDLKEAKADEKSEKRAEKKGDAKEAKKMKLMEAAAKLKASGHKKEEVADKIRAKGNPELAKALELVWDLAKSEDPDEAKAKHEDELEEKKKDRKAKQIEDNQVADAAVAEAEPKELVAEEREEKKIEKASPEDGGDLEKAAGAKGEGSRGGHVIGHTKSGKPIYENDKKSGEAKEWKGSGHGNAELGDKVKHIKEMEPGKVYAQTSHQFGAKNMFKVTKNDGEKVHGHFVNPRNHDEKRLLDDREHVLWDHDIHSANMEHHHIKEKSEPAKRPSERKLGNGYTAKIEHEKRAHVYAPNGEKIDTVHSADAERVAKEHAKKTKKSIPWSEGTQALLKASTRRGQNCHYDVEEMILKSDKETKEIIAKGGYLSETKPETLVKSEATEGEATKPSINDMIEKGMDYGSDQIDRIQRLAKAQANGPFTVQSFSNEDFAKAMPLPMSPEDARKEATVEGGISPEAENAPSMGMTDTGKAVHEKSYKDHEDFDSDDHAQAAKMHQAKAEELHAKSRDAKMEHEKAELEKARDAHDLHAAYHDACAVNNKTRAKAYSKELDKCYAGM